MGDIQSNHVISSEIPDTLTCHNTMGMDFIHNYFISGHVSFWCKKKKKVPVAYISDSSQKNSKQCYPAWKQEVCQTEDHSY